MAGYRFEFAPSGLGITGEDLGRPCVEDVVKRWCCSVGRMSPIGELGCPILRLTAKPDRSRSRSWKRVDRNGLHLERFGSWRSVLRPGGVRDEVEPVRSPSSESFDFQQSFDLCMTHLLAMQGGVVLHGSVFDLGGVGVFALGDSGSGKTTLAAASLRAGGRVVSDDLVLASVSAIGEIAAATLRREMLLREAGFSVLPAALRQDLWTFDDAGETRWQLSPDQAPARFKHWTRPQKLWLVSVDRRLKASRVAAVDQATALTWLIRGTTALFLRAPFHEERLAVLATLRNLAEDCPAFRIRLGRDLLEAPVATLDRLLRADGR